MCIYLKRIKRTNATSESANQGNLGVAVQFEIVCINQLCQNPKLVQMTNFVYLLYSVCPKLTPILANLSFDAN